MARRVAVVGYGLIGQSWARTFHDHGYEVAAWDPALEVALDPVPDPPCGPALDSARGCAQGEAWLDRPTTLEQTVAGAVLVIEAAPEDARLKTSIFANLDRHTAAGVPIVSSSSGLLPSSFLTGLPGAHRCLVAHPPNPPEALPLVELVPGPETDAATIQRTVELLEGIGKQVAVLRHETEGYILNRLQSAMTIAALDLVTEGIAEVDDVDRVVLAGLGRRWAVGGLFENLDLNADGGFAGFWDRFGGLYSRIGRAAAQDRGPLDADGVREVEERDARAARLAHDQLRRRDTVATPEDLRNRRLRRLRALDDFMTKLDDEEQR